MIEKDDVAIFELCSRLMDEGKYIDALHQAESILNPGYQASIFVDAGFALSKPGVVRKGIALFEKLIASEERKEFASYLYNTANGYSSLYSLRRQRRSKTTPPNDKDLRLAKRLLSRGVERTSLSKRRICIPGTCQFWQLPFPIRQVH